MAESRLNAPAADELLTAFRTYYHKYTAAINDAILSSADTNVLERLGDDLDEYSRLASQVHPDIVL